MIGKRVWVLMIVLALSLGLAGIAPATPLLEVNVPDKDTWLSLMSGNFDILEGPVTDGSVLYIMGWPHDMARLSQYNYRVFIDDMEAWNASRLEHVIGTMGGYPTYSETLTWLTNLAANHPNLVSTPMVAGYTLQGRQMPVFKISDNPNSDEDEPEVFINSLIHAREPVGLLASRFFAEYLVNNYGVDQRVTDLVNTHEIWFMPITNPDGYVHNEQTDPDGGGMWRKNLSNPNGVDLNRNFDYMWGYDNQGSSPDPYSETYRGPSAGSEPETQVVKDFINSRHFEAVMNYHTYSNLIILPWGYTYERPPDYDLYLAYGNYMNETIGFEVGGPEIIYTTNGDAEDWQAAGDPDVPTSADYHMWSFTIEIGTWQQGGFWPTYNTGVTIANAQMEVLMRFCEIAENPWILMAPVAPVMTIPDEVPPAFTATWTHDDPHGNDALYYDFAELIGPYTTEGAESATALAWESDGFSRSTARYYAGSRSYYSGQGNSISHSLTGLFSFNVPANTDLTFWTWYSIEDNYDYAYVSASTDGQNWTNLQGNITTNYDPHGINQGNGITGSTGAFVQGIFPLDVYAGQNIFLKFSYITDGGVSEEGIYFDEITPMQGFGQMNILADNIPNPSFAMDYGNVQDPFMAYFTARAIDAQDQVGPWADVDATLVTPGGAEITLDLTGIHTAIGPNGGSVTYSAHLLSILGTPVPGVTYWTMAQLPNGNMYGPISTINFNIPAHADLTVPLMQVQVPGMAPAGMYTFFGNVGYLPSTILASDSFTFTKAAGVNSHNGNGVASWSESGWPKELAASPDATLPTQFAVDLAYPNPFNPTVTVPFALPSAGEVRVVVSNTLGQTVFQNVSVFSAGQHQFTVDGSGFASGIYLLSVNCNGVSDVQKIVLMK